MIKKLFIITIFFLFLSFSVYGSTYLTYGHNYFYGGISQWNEDFTDVETTTKALSSSSANIAVCDSNGDSINEIAAINGKSLRLYDTSLNLLASYSIGTYIESNIYCFDLDSSGNVEYIIVDDAGRVAGLSYNGSTLVRSYNFSGITHTYPLRVSWIGCHGSTCVLSSQEGQSGASGLSALFYYSFNSSQVLQTVQGTTTGTNTQCSALHPKPNIADIDNDGATEFVSGGLLIDSNNAEGLWLASAKMLSNGTIYKGLEYKTNSLSGMSNYLTGTLYTRDCYSVGSKKNYSHYTSGAYVVEAESSGIWSILISVVVQDERFLTYAFDGSDTSIFERYPSVNYGKGLYLSNIAKADIFDDTANDEYCTLGVRPSDNLLDMLCISPKSGRNIQFTYAQENRINEPKYNGVASNSLHTTDSYTNNVDFGYGFAPHDTTEFVTSYGIFTTTISNGDCENLIDVCSQYLCCDMDKIYSLSFDNAAIYPVDYENSDYADLIIHRNKSISIFDDNSTNLNCQQQNCLTRIEICPESPFRQNTTVEVNTIVSEVDGDNVYYNITFYYKNQDGIIPESSGYINATDGFTGQWYFHPYNLTQYSQWRIDVYDAVNPTEVFSYGGGFVVSGVGNQYGDECFTLNYDNVIITVPGLTATTAAVSSDNAITGVVDGFAEAGNLSTTLIWLFFMLVAGIATMATGGYQSYVTNSATPIIITGIVAIIIEATMLVMGTLLGFFSVGILIIFIVLGLILLGLIVSKIVLSGG